MPCKVQEDTEQRPIVVTLFREEAGVAAIDDWWEDAEFWWRNDPVVRVTYQVVLDDGPTADHLQEKNLLHGGW